MVEDEEIKIVELELTKLEWEIVHQALSAPTRDVLIRRLMEVGYDITDDEMDKAWDSVSEKWLETW